MNSSDLSSATGIKIPAILPAGLGFYPPPSATPASSSSALDAAAVARRAYEKWELSNHAPGHDQENWFAAEAELRRERQTAPAIPASQLAKANRRLLAQLEAGQLAAQWN